MPLWRNFPLVKRFGRISRLCIEGLEARALLTAPFVTSTAFNYQTGHSLAVTFSANVSGSLSNVDLVVYNLSDRTTVPSSKIAVGYNSTTNTATFAFSGFNGGILPDAN